MYMSYDAVFIAGNDAAVFTIGSETYLSIAQYELTEIYKYNGTAFASFQKISCGASLCIGVTSFAIDGNQYIVISSYNMDDGSVYQFSQKSNSFVHYQQISATTPRKFEYATINGFGDDVSRLSFVFC